MGLLAEPLGPLRSPCHPCLVTKNRQPLRNEPGPVRRSEQSIQANKEDCNNTSDMEEVGREVSPVPESHIEGLAHRADAPQWRDPLPHDPSCEGIGHDWEGYPGDLGAIPVDGDHRDSLRNDLPPAEQQMPEFVEGLMVVVLEVKEPVGQPDTRHEGREPGPCRIVAEPLDLHRLTPFRSSATVLSLFFGFHGSSGTSSAS